MKGDANVIEFLNQVLKAELTAINQYFLHAEMCENWGYKRLAKLAKKESIEEMVHAEKCMERILYLDGTPNMTDYFKINIGATVEAQFKNDLNLEYDAVKRLNEGIKLCVAVGDNGSRDLAQKILSDEEHHIDWLEGQLHAIGEMGISNYLAQQLKEGEGATRTARHISCSLQYVTMKRRRGSGVTARRFSQRRDGRVAEGARLESVCT